MPGRLANPFTRAMTEPPPAGGHTTSVAESPVQRWGGMGCPPRSVVYSNRCISKGKQLSDQFLSSFPADETGQDGSPEPGLASPVFTGRFAIRRSGRTSELLDCQELALLPPPRERSPPGDEW